MTLVHSLGPLGTDDRFVISSIPVGSERLGGRRTPERTIRRQPSRVNLEVRSPTPLTPLRTFIEADFIGTGNTARLRHAYRRLLPRLRPGLPGPVALQRVEARVRSVRCQRQPAQPVARAHEPRPMGSFGTALAA